MSQKSQDENPQHKDPDYKPPLNDAIIKELIKPKEVEILDTGDRTEFLTGAVRDRGDMKGRMDLMPWRAIREVSMLMQKGALKYDARNWEKGIPVHEYLNSGIRHASDVLIGKDDEGHFTAAAWNMLCGLDTVLRIKEGILPEDLYEIPGGIDKCVTHSKN